MTSQEAVDWLEEFDEVSGRAFQQDRDAAHVLVAFVASRVLKFEVGGADVLIEGGSGDCQFAGSVFDVRFR